MSSESDFRRMLEGFSLTTANILYRMPDHPALLQTFTWQEYDMFPKFPRLMRFCDFWQTNLNGPIVHVTVAHRHLITPAELRFATGAFRLN